MALLSAVAVDSFGTGLFAPLSLLYFVALTTMPLTTIGALTSAGVLVSLPVPFLAGSLADRYGARLVVILGQLLQAGGFAAYLVVRRPLPVFIALAIVAVGQRLFWSTFFTMVATVEGADEGRGMDRRFARVGMIQAAGLGIGALVAGAAASANSDTAYELIAAANALTFTVSAAMLLRVPVRVVRPAPERPASRSGYRTLMRDRPYLGLIVANVPLAICSVLLGTALPVYLVKALAVPGWIVGPLLAVNTAALASGQLAATRFVKHVSRTRAMMTAGLIWAAWAAVMALALAIPWPGVAVWLFGAVLLYASAEIIHAPTSNALAAAAAHEEFRGRYLAVFQYGFTVATMVVPVGFTSLFAIAPELPWLVVMVLGVVSAAAFALLQRGLGDRDAV